MEVSLWSCGSVLANVLIAIALLSACQPHDPVLRLQKKLDRFPEYAIILNDMRSEGNFFTDYFHQYKIIANKDRDAAAHEQVLSDWQRVSPSFYRQHADNLGMVLAAKTIGGEQSSVPQPPGYQYIGNQQYGRWVERDGTSFWEFYGKYALISSVFGMMHSPFYRHDYDVFRDRHRRNLPYYGKRNGKRNEFGSHGTETRKRHANFFQRRQQRTAMRRQAFSRRVSTRATRSHHSGFRRGGWGFGK